MNFVVFSSGQGGNLQAIIDAVQNKKIKGKISCVFCNKAKAYTLKRAARAKIPSLCLNPDDFPSREAFDKEVLQYLKGHSVDFIVLAGYKRLLSGYFIRHFRDKILNIHPTLLPAFKGLHGIRDAFDYGVKLTGVTVHFVVEEMDTGVIIAQEPVRVDPKDTKESLERKIHRVEHRIYPKVINLFAQGKIKIVGRQVVIG